MSRDRNNDPSAGALVAAPEGGAELAAALPPPAEDASVTASVRIDSDTVVNDGVALAGPELRVGMVRVDLDQPFVAFLTAGLGPLGEGIALEVRATAGAGAGERARVCTRRAELRVAGFEALAALALPPWIDEPGQVSAPVFLEILAAVRFRRQVHGYDDESWLPHGASALSLVTPLPSVAVPRRSPGWVARARSDGSLGLRRRAMGVFYLAATVLGLMMTGPMLAGIAYGVVGYVVGAASAPALVYVGERCVHALGEPFVRIYADRAEIAHHVVRRHGAVAVSAELLDAGTRAMVPHLVVYRASGPPEGVVTQGTMKQARTLARILSQAWEVPLGAPSAPALEAG